MRLRHYLIALLVLSLGAYCMSAFALHNAITETHGLAEHTYPKVDYGTGEHAELVRRGEYLAKVGDCIACHTTKDGKAYAGGLPFKTPLGTFYSPNITPDRTTGIGRWTEEQFIRCMQKGIRADGSYAYPAFPYIYFTRITKPDLKALKAYFDAIPPVRQRNHKNDVPFPFNIRTGMIVWNLLFFDFYRGEYKPNPKESTLWNRGAYIVQGLGHCGMCHTPKVLGFFAAGPNRKYAYTGNLLFEGIYAPGITSTNLKDIPLEDIVNVFAKDQKLGTKAAIRSPMKEVNHDSLQHLNLHDLTAIAVYLKTVKSAIPKSQRVSGELTSKTGEKIYEGHCAVCHTTGAGGAPKIGDISAWASRIAQGDQTLYTNAIKGIRSMPTKGACMSCGEAQIKAAVDYLTLKSGGGAPERVHREPVHKLTMADGERVYNKVCAVCHDIGHLDAPKIGDQVAWAPLIKKNMDVLIEHSLKGYRNMPSNGACSTCSHAEVIAAVKYLVQKSQSTGDYKLW